MMMTRLRTYGRVQAREAGNAPRKKAELLRNAREQPMILNYGLPNSVGVFEADATTVARRPARQFYHWTGESTGTRNTPWTRTRPLSR